MFKHTIIALLSLFAIGAAQAATTVNFGAPTSCPSYCTGFTTDNAAYVLNNLNPTYATTTQRTTLAVNGKSYAGSDTATVLTVISGHTYYQIDGLLQASDGSVLSVSYVLEVWTTKVTSGRDAGRLTTHRAVNGGSFTL